MLSLCAGDGRDLLGVLAERDDAARVSATLVEVLPELVDRARAAAAGLAADVEVVAGDAGRSDTYAGLVTVPADVVLVVGVLGNVPDADVGSLVAALPQLCAPAATLVWSRGRSVDDTVDAITPVRAALAGAGFGEVSVTPFDVGGDHTALGVVRYDGPAVPLERGGQWFTFVG